MFVTFFPSHSNFTSRHSVVLIHYEFPIIINGVRISTSLQELAPGDVIVVSMSLTEAGRLLASSHFPVLLKVQKNKVIRYAIHDQSRSVHDAAAQLDHYVVQRRKGDYLSPGGPPQRRICGNWLTWWLCSRL